MDCDTPFAANGVFPCISCKLAASTTTASSFAPGFKGTTPGSGPASETPSTPKGCTVKRSSSLCVAGRSKPTGSPKKTPGGKRSASAAEQAMPMPSAGTPHPRIATTKPLKKEVNLEK
jgi:hypothetical protein